MKSYKLTLRRRHADGQLDEVVYKVEHDCRRMDGNQPGGDCPCAKLDEDAHVLLLVDMEHQANSGLPLDGARGMVRAWIDESR